MFGNPNTSNGSRHQYLFYTSTVKGPSLDDQNHEGQDVIFSAGLQGMGQLVSSEKGRRWLPSKVMPRKRRAHEHPSWLTELASGTKINTCLCSDFPSNRSGKTAKIIQLHDENGGQKWPETSRNINRPTEQSNKRLLGQRVHWSEVTRGNNRSTGRRWRYRENPNRPKDGGKLLLWKFYRFTFDCYKVLRILL